MAQLGRLDCAALFILGLDCLLRTAEVLQVLPGHVTLTSTARGVLLLLLMKSGQRRGESELVTIEDDLVVTILRHAFWGKAPAQPLLTTSAHDFRVVWKQALHMIHMDPEVFKPYSLRRGGATHHYMHVGRISDRSIGAGGTPTLRAASTSSRAKGS